jgi:hypothetical protein
MPKKTINQKTILKELRQVPKERWGAILTFIRSLQANPQSWPGIPHYRHG